MASSESVSLALLEALAMDDAGTTLAIFLSRDPHLSEGRQRRQNRASDPSRVLAFGRRRDPDLGVLGRHEHQLLEQSLAES